MRRLAVVAVIAVAISFLLFARATTPPEVSIVERVRRAGGESRAPGAGDRAAAPSDLPPAGTRSLFDHLLKENGGLPFPFDRLLDLLASHDAAGRRPVAVLIPDGRSLLKARASAAHPRVVVAADVHPPDSPGDFGLILRGRLFLGYVEEAHEIEVVSFNEQAGRFEFQLVSHYGEGETPVIAYARRSLCVTCHQNAAPIFPERPWDESNSRPEVAERIVTARRDLTGSPPGEIETLQYFGVPVVAPLANAEAFDDLVGVGNELAAAERAWMDGCGTEEAGPECRRRMLAVALAYLWRPGELSAADVRALRLLEVQRRVWPAAGVVIPNPSIRNRDPSSDGVAAVGFVQDLRTWFAGRPRAEIEDQDPLESFERTAPLRSDLDPLTVRRPLRVVGAASLEGAVAVAGLFGPRDRALLEQASSGNFDVVERAVGSERVSALLGPGPLRRVEMMRALLAQMGVRTLPRSCCETDEGMSPAVAHGVAPLRLRDGSPLEPFDRYCFGCHRGNPSARLDFMNGTTETEVLARIRKEERMREVLDWERYSGTAKEGALMPPRDSYQRGALQRARSEGRMDLEAMLAVVPEGLGF